MTIDQQTAQEEWIDRMQSNAVPKLCEDARFDNPRDLTDLFNGAANGWREGSEFRQLTNFGNEIGAAQAILETLQSSDKLFYEPPLANTNQSIDFLVLKPSGAKIWMDMKTVSPTWDDGDSGWERFERIAGDFPQHATLIVDRDFGGAGLSGQLIKSRWSFIKRTLELERKVALLSDVERGGVRLLFCSNGSWQEDDLEDFADFYRTGHFRPDDPLSNATRRYIEDEGVEFLRNLDGFSYISRSHESDSYDEFTFHVHG